MEYAKSQIRVNELPEPVNPLSYAISAGPLIFVSGQTPRNPKTGQVPDGIEEQTHQVFRNIDAVLKAAGSSLADVLKVTAYLSDLSDRNRFNEIYRQYLSEPYPARTSIGCQLEGIRLEIDVIALARR